MSSYDDALLSCSCELPRRREGCESGVQMSSGSARLSSDGRWLPATRPSTIGIACSVSRPPLSEDCTQCLYAGRRCRIRLAPRAKFRRDTDETPFAVDCCRLS